MDKPRGIVFPVVIEGIERQFIIAFQSTRLRQYEGRIYATDNPVYQSLTVTSGASKREIHIRRH